MVTLDDLARAYWWAEHYRRLIILAKLRLVWPMPAVNGAERVAKRSELRRQIKQWEDARADHLSGRTARSFALHRYVIAVTGLDT